MSFQNKIIKSIESAVNNMHKGKPQLVPTDNDIIETTAKVVTRVVSKGKVFSF